MREREREREKESEREKERESERETGSERDREQLKKIGTTSTKLSALEYSPGMKVRRMFFTSPTSKSLEALSAGMIRLLMNTPRERLYVK